MKQKYVIILLCIGMIVKSFSALAQKAVLNQTALENWPEISGEQISNDGQYILYSVYSKDSGFKLFIHSVKDNFKIQIPDCRYPSQTFFTENSKYALYIAHQDSLCVYDLNLRTSIYIPGVQSFKIPKEGSGEWLAYQLKNNQLILLNLVSGESKNYEGVHEYTFSKTGKALLLQTTDKNNAGTVMNLQWINSGTGQSVKIWGGSSNPTNTTFDDQENQLAFLAKADTGQQSAIQIWHYNLGQDSAQVCVNEHSTGMEPHFTVADEEIKFSPDGDKLFFSIRNKQVAQTPDPNLANVTIWNYKDEYLQPDQKYALGKNSYKSVFNFGTYKVIRLEQEKDGMWGESELNNGSDADFLLAVTKGNLSDQEILKNERQNIYLVDTRNGTRKQIGIQLLWAQPKFSPGGKYVIWYDYAKKAFYSYNIERGITTNISEKIPEPVYDELWDLPAQPSPYTPTYGGLVWLPNDQAVLIGDRYDIWAVDPEGKKMPKNITNGYGRKTKTILRYVYENTEGKDQTVKNNIVLLCGFSELSKKNGFFQDDITHAGNPVKLVMSSGFFYFSSALEGIDFGTHLLKAKQSNEFLLTFRSATEYPNLQTTKDFTTFEPVSNLEPQTKFNWLTSELVRWKTFNGKQGEGILYKPENFDSNKKYPIIFYFYERLSAGLNSFITPDFSDGPINIPWFVSHGYLVFCPDIHYSVGEPAASVYNYVVSAAKFMTSKPWIDKTKMGIEGHSFGGYEVNCLITSTGLFAAAASASGASDLISHRGEINFASLATDAFTEYAIYRMGATLWQRPGLYLKNSPIFKANKVTTPILLMNNDEDNRVPFGQGVEFFTALRRLGKRTWMLEYENDGHTVSDNDAVDYTERLTQFFDHYLKGSPAPKWMTVGVPYSQKGLDSGLGLDLSGNQP